MATELYDARFHPEALAQQWAPSEGLRTWLAVGLGALAFYLALVLAGAILEQKHWGEKGLTPDVVVGYLAMVPAACVLLAYLKVAREIQDRGLWKSAAGMFAASLIAIAAGLAIEELPRDWIFRCNTLAAAGLIGLVIFSFSKRPHISRSHSLAGTGSQRDGLSASDPSQFGETVDSAETENEEGGGGCLVHVGIGLCVFGVKVFLRQGNGRLPNFNLGVDDWALAQGAMLLVIGLGYATWFAIAKIRLRHELGGLAAVLGSVELLLLLAYAGTLAALVVLIATTVANNPQLDDDGIDKLLDPWLMRASVVTAVCQTVWIALTALLFASLWLRPQPDWRESFLAPK